MIFFCDFKVIKFRETHIFLVFAFSERVDIWVGIAIVDDWHPETVSER